MGSTLNGRSSLSESLSSFFEHVLPENGVIACGCVQMQDQDIRLLAKLDSLICARDDAQTLSEGSASVTGFSPTALNPPPPLLQQPQPQQAPPQLFSEDHSGEKGYPRNARSATIPELGARKTDKYRKAPPLLRACRASGLVWVLREAFSSLPFESFELSRYCSVDWDELNFFDDGLAMPVLVFVL